jgi:hypothetical protein
MFTLHIPVTVAAIEEIKLGLTKSLPEIKSSHRVEALGRGLGFRTYAALLASSRLSEPTTTTVKGAEFSAYLAEHNFETVTAHLYKAAARVAIRQALEAVPRLTIRGIGTGQPKRNADGSWQTPSQNYSEFLELRNECLDQRSAEAFLRSLALLQHIRPTKTIRASTGSYRLKHVAENYVCSYPEGEKLGPDYVPNGMLIAAAVHMGFKYKTHIDHLGYETLNTTFNMSKVDIDDLDARIRPRTGFAQDRVRKQYAMSQTN